MIHVQPSVSSDMDYKLTQTPSDRAFALEQMSNDELERVFVQGTTPDIADLAGWEFRGMNVPGWAKLAGIKKFIKGFFYSGGVDHYGRKRAMGYNCPVEQSPIDEPWSVKPSEFAPKRFGFYELALVDASSKENKYLHAALLNYGRGGNPALDPSAGLRDYLIQVDADNRDLFLGKAYYALGPARIATNFFILERLRVGVDRDPRV